MKTRKDESYCPKMLLKDVQRSGGMMIASGRLFHVHAATAPIVHVKGIISAERIQMF